VDGRLLQDRPRYAQLQLDLLRYAARSLVCFLLPLRCLRESYRALQGTVSKRNLHGATREGLVIHKAYSLLLRHLWRINGRLNRQYTHNQAQFGYRTTLDSDYYP
jgi:hypothetical protein